MANGNHNNGGAVEMERRHYAPEFSASDPKWSCWPARQHVQKAAYWVSVATALLGAVLFVAVLFLLRPLYLRFAFLCVCVILCVVSGLALLANLRQHSGLFLPYLYVLWLANIASFTVFWFLVPMIVVPHFWHGWVLSGFGMGPHSVGVVRLITAACALCAFLVLCVLTLFNFTVLRARNFVLAKHAARVAHTDLRMVTKGGKTEQNDVERNGEGGGASTRRVRVVDTVA